MGSRLAALARLKTAALVATAAALGLVAPFRALPLGLLVTPLVVILVYSSLRSIETETLRSATVGPSIVSLLVSYVALPVAAVALGTLVLPRPAFVGVLAMVVGPTTAGSALVWTRLSSGNVAVAGLVSVASVAVAPVVTPAVLSLSLGAQVSIAPLSILRELGIVVGCGAVLAWVVPDDRITDDGIELLSLAAIVVLVYVGVVTNTTGETSLGTIGPVAVAALAITCLGFVLSAGAGTFLGFSVGQQRALYFTTSLKNLGIAIVVGSALAVDGVGSAIVTYYVVEQLAGGLAVGFLSPST